MAISIVQTLSKTEGTSVASLQSAAFGSSPVTGNTIIVLLWGYRNGSCTIAVNDNAGNTYVEDKAKQDNSDPGIGYFNQIWRCTNITGGSGFKITASGAGSTSYFTFGAIEVSGLAASPIDQSNSDTNTGT